MNTQSRTLVIGIAAGVGVVAAALAFWLLAPLLALKVATFLVAVLTTLLAPRRPFYFGFDLGYRIFFRHLLLRLAILVITIAIAVPICKFAYTHYYAPMNQMSYGQDNGQ